MAEAAGAAPLNDAGPVAESVTSLDSSLPPLSLTTCFTKVNVENGAHTATLGTGWLVLIDAVLPKPPPSVQSPLVWALTTIVAVTLTLYVWVAPASSCVPDVVTPALSATKFRPTGFVVTDTLLTVTPLPKPKVSFSE